LAVQHHWRSRPQNGSKRTSSGHAFRPVSIASIGSSASGPFGIATGGHGPTLCGTGGHGGDAGQSCFTMQSDKQRHGPPSARRISCCNAIFIQHRTITNEFCYHGSGIFRIGRSTTGFRPWFCAGPAFCSAATILEMPSIGRRGQIGTRDPQLTLATLLAERIKGVDNMLRGSEGSPR
jgi:hypothetical protein